jgi:hypothetical protein
MFDVSCLVSKFLGFMAAVYLHTTGTYYAKYFNSLGKRVSKNTGVSSKQPLRIANGFESDERDLKKKEVHLPRMFTAIVETAAREAATGDFTLARAEELILRLHRLANPSFKVVSLDDHLKNWIEEQKAHVELSTFTSNNDRRRRGISALGKQISNAAVDDLTAAQVREGLEKMKASGLTSSTVNQDHRVLRRALDKAVIAGLAKVNVAYPGFSARPAGPPIHAKHNPYKASPSAHGACSPKGCSRRVPVVASAAPFIVVLYV